MKKLPFCLLFLPTLLISITVNVFAPGNKSLLQFSLCFLFGYFIFSNGDIQDKIEKNALVLGFLWLIFMILRPISHINNSLWNSSFSYFVLHGVTIFGILSLLGLGKKFLNSEFVFTKYFFKAEFSLYLIHQTIIVFLGYFLLKIKFSPYLTWIVITFSSFAITIIIYQFTLSIKNFINKKRLTNQSIRKSSSIFLGHLGFEPRTKGL